MALMAQPYTFVGGEEAGPEHALPQALGGEGVLADDDFRQVRTAWSMAPPQWPMPASPRPAMPASVSTLTMKYLRPSPWQQKVLIAVIFMCINQCS